MNNVLIFHIPYTYSIEDGYIKVNNKRMKIKQYKNYGIVFRLNKTCITTTTEENFKKFIDKSIKDDTCICLVKKIFDSVLERGEFINE